MCKIRKVIFDVHITEDQHFQKHELYARGTHDKQNTLNLDALKFAQKQFQTFIHFQPLRFFTVVLHKSRHGNLSLNISALLAGKRILHQLCIPFRDTAWRGQNVSRIQYSSRLENARTTVGGQFFAHCIRERENAHAYPSLHSYVQRCATLDCWANSDTRV